MPRSLPLRSRLCTPVSPGVRKPANVAKGIWVGSTCQLFTHPDRDSMVPHKPHRRHFLGHSLKAVAATGLMGTGAHAWAFPSTPRSLSFDHTHTNERINLVFAQGDNFLPQALNRLNTFLRDHYNGAVGMMDPQLFDGLYRIRQALGTRASYEVISGYRSPATNSMLKETRGGGVARHSLHMEGKAIDVRLPGVPLAELRDAARSLQLGGVGFYSHEQFVHIDTGRVRTWGA